MDRPVFVMGSMGSGTTLLRLILDSHPNLAIGQETGFLRAANAQYFIPFWRSGDVWLERLGLTTDDLDDSVRSFYDDVFTKFATRQGARRWGDKTPYHIWHMQLAARLWPDAQFVATVRHPGAVANSLGRFKWKWPRGVAHWQRANREMSVRGAELGDRFFMVRYEDLVNDAEPVLREILQFLDEPWDDRVMQHHAVQPSRGQDTVVEGRTRSDEPIDPGRVAKWVAATSVEERRLMARRTNVLGEVFGYDPTDPNPVAPLNHDDSTRFGITGTMLGDYMAAIPGISALPMPSPTFENALYTPDALAQELRKAFIAGRNDEHVRDTYRRRVESGVPRKRPAKQPPKPAKPPVQVTPGLVAKVRRRAARLLDPDRRQTPTRKAPQR